VKKYFKNKYRHSLKPILSFILKIKVHFSQ
jgi:hypothetical protein